MNGYYMQYDYCDKSPDDTTRRPEGKCRLIVVANHKNRVLPVSTTRFQRTRHQESSNHISPKSHQHRRRRSVNYYAPAKYETWARCTHVRKPDGCAQIFRRKIIS